MTSGSRNWNEYEFRTKLADQRKIFVIVRGKVELFEVEVKKRIAVIRSPETKKAPVGPMMAFQSRPER